MRLPTDDSFLSVIGRPEGEAERTAPFHPSVGGVMPPRPLRGVDDGEGYGPDRDDLLTVRQTCVGTGGSHGQILYLRNDYELPVS